MIRLPWLLLLSVLLHGQSAASPPLTETVLPALDTCRFLMSGAAAEPWQPLGPERVAPLQTVLEQTGVGAMVVTYLRRFQREGLKA